MGQAANHMACNYTWVCIDAPKQKEPATTSNTGQMEAHLFSHSGRQAQNPLGSVSDSWQVKTPDRGYSKDEPAEASQLLLRLHVKGAAEQHLRAVCNPAQLHMHANGHAATKRLVMLHPVACSTSTPHR